MSDASEREKRRASDLLFALRFLDVLIQRAAVELAAAAVAAMQIRYMRKRSRRRKEGGGIKETTKEKIKKRERKNITWGKRKAKWRKLQRKEKPRKEKTRKKKRQRHGKG